MPVPIEITDVTLRDGLQMESKIIPTEDKFQLFLKLLGCGYHRLEITSFVHPKKVPQFAESEAFCELVFGQSKLPKPIEWMAFVPNEKGLERLLAFPIPWVSTFIATSEEFNKRNIDQTIKESLATLAKTMDRAHKEKRRVRVYISTAFGCPYQGRIPLDHFLAVLKQVVALEPDEIALSDTIGVATPNAVREVALNVGALFPMERIALHLHNTYGMALACLLTAVSLGISKFDGSTGGIGGCPYAKGATGNIATEEILYALVRQEAIPSIQVNSIWGVMKYLHQSLGLQIHSPLYDILEKGGSLYGIG